MSRGSLSTSKDARSHIEDFIKQSAELFSEEKLKALLIGDKLDNKFGREDCLKSIQQIENFYYEAKSLLEDNLRECGRLKPSFCNWEFVPMDENFSDQRIIEGQTPLPFIDKKYEEKKDLARMERRENLQQLRIKYGNKCDLHRGLYTLSNYYALSFEEQKFLILESMEYGNAVFLVKGDWKYLSQRTKSQLIYKDYADKIDHDAKGHWKEKLRRKIKREMSYFG